MTPAPAIPSRTRPPACEAEERQPYDAHRIRGTEPMSPADGDRDTQRILIVDDEPAVREALQRSLAFEGYGTEVAVDGAQALEKAAAYRPDLLVLDMQMPRMDGLTAARRIRAAGDTTPILMLTARDTVGDRVTGLDAGADDYLVKPFELDELFARIRALLRRSSYAAAVAASAESNDVLTFGDLSMNLSTREVRRGSRPVELTRTEFTLLEMFMAHPRRSSPGSRSSRPSGASTSSRR
ncbi:DNA-binding response regulator OS=Streptomyces fumanus OX=67302 GN=GCM10018772_29300 PE=4 SV=1 [Streptomyces fumanus]